MEVYLGLADLLKDAAIFLGPRILDLGTRDVKVVIARRAGHLALGLGTRIEAVWLVAVPCAEGFRARRETLLLACGLALRLLANCLAFALIAAGASPGADDCAVRLAAFDSARFLDDRLAEGLAGGGSALGSADLVADGVITLPITQRLALATGLVNDASFVLVVVFGLLLGGGGHGPVDLFEFGFIQRNK